MQGGVIALLCACLYEGSCTDSAAFNHHSVTCFICNGLRICQGCQTAHACCSSKREPLGRGYVRGHHIPAGLGAAVPFGVAVHAKVSSLYTIPTCKPLLLPFVILSDELADSVTAAFSICCVVPSLTCTALENVRPDTGLCSECE